MKHMSYTTNPFLLKVRMQAVMLVRSGWSMRKVSRYIRVNASTISRWCQKAPPKGSCGIATESSKPKTSPSDDIVNEILVERLKHGRCGNVVHQVLLNRGFNVSLSTVNRTLDRAEFLKKKSNGKDSIETRRDHSLSLLATLYRLIQYIFNLMFPTGTDPESTSTH
ncbi:MAG: hypothetical protein BWY95_00904 [Bacteroidetes bacterium ADurb.BinA104]|nr:MAG: hypothetical protein BWY95_00904 [Bacteroidetes bacterium ADurb.BinA104]